VQKPPDYQEFTGAARQRIKNAPPDGQPGHSLNDAAPGGEYIRAGTLAVRGAYLTNAR
jgi:hypothetical protein